MPEPKAQRAFIAIQTALGGESVGDAWQALNDSFAVCIAYAAQDLEHADKLIEISVEDLRAAVRRYWPEARAARAASPVGQARA